jgi:hypothetical protein
MTTVPPVPLDNCAFGDPMTRRTYERVRLRVVVSLIGRVATWVALLVVAKAVETDAQLVEGTASFLLLPGSLVSIGPARRLLWMQSVGNALKAYPWQQCAVTHQGGVRVYKGTPVQVQVFGGSGDVLHTSVMTARTWRLRRPRSGLLAKGTWFAGDPNRGGVIATPGGRVLMSVRHTMELELKVPAATKSPALE